MYVFVEFNYINCRCFAGIFPERLSIQVKESDIFIGFFGARYGWHGLDDKSLQSSIDKALPDYPWLEQYRDRSITEMEFLEARLKSPETTKPAAFFFREQEYDARKFKELEGT